MRGGVREVRGGVREVRGGVREVRGGVREVRGGVREVRGGVREVRGGVREMRGGGREMRGGLRKGCYIVNIICNNWPFPVSLRYCKVQSTVKCQICGTRLMTSSFYMFPCQHAYHKDCLTKEVERCHDTLCHGYTLTFSSVHVPSHPQLLQLLPPGHVDRERLQSAVREVGGAQGKEEAKVCMEGGGGGIEWKGRVVNLWTPILQAKLDGILGAECIYCGGLMIDCIDRHFEALDAQDDSWN